MVKSNLETIDSLNTNKDTLLLSSGRTQRINLQY